MTTFPAADPYQEKGGYVTVPFELERGAKEAEGSILRYVDAAPFVPCGVLSTRERRCEEILSIQAMGLKKRLEHTGCKNAVSRPFRRSGFHAGSFGDGSGL